MLLRVAGQFASCKEHKLGLLELRLRCDPASAMDERRRDDYDKVALNAWQQAWCFDPGWNTLSLQQFDESLSARAIGNTAKFLPAFQGVLLQSLTLELSGRCRSA